MPIQIVDDFGAWDDLGSKQPEFETWLSFPDYTESKSSLLRIRSSFETFDRNSYGYLRCVYTVSAISIMGRWVRFYPKLEDEFLIYPHPEDLEELKSNPIRRFQVMKRHRYRRKIGTLRSTLWSVNVLVCNEDLTNNNNNNQQNITIPPLLGLGLL